MSATILRFPIRPDTPARRLVVHLHNMGTNYIRDAILPPEDDGRAALDAIMTAAQKNIGNAVQNWGFKVEFVRTSP